MLNGRLRLHNIEDVETWCNKIVSEKWVLRPHEREDLLAYLIATAWELSLRYDPGRSSVQFSTYLTTILKARAVDWLRTYKGRTKWGSYERALPELVSLSGLDGAEHRVPVDSTPDRSPDLMRALREGLGEDARSAGGHGEGVDGRPPRRDRRAA